MADAIVKAKAKCPGWPHDYFHPHHPATQARQANGDLDPICELDQAQYRWESFEHLPTTTVAEREAHRAALHQGGK